MGVLRHFVGMNSLPWLTQRPPFRQTLAVASHLFQRVSDGSSDGGSVGPKSGISSHSAADMRIVFSLALAIFALESALKHPSMLCPRSLFLDPSWMQFRISLPCAFAILAKFLFSWLMQF